MRNLSPSFRRYRTREPGGNDLVLLHEIPDNPFNDQELTRARIPKLSFWLLRPDGHIGLAGTRFEPAALNRYLAERVALHASGPHHPH